MQFGVCTSPDQADQAKQYGWDFIELNVQQAFHGLVEDAQYTPPPPTALPTPAANSLMPGQLKIVGPDANIDVLSHYLTNVMRRAAAIDCRTIVFGSGAARAVPLGWERDRAHQQLVDFLLACSVTARDHGITVVIEPLNRNETNILNTLGECIALVREVNQPNVRQLIDTYHFWLEDDSLDALRDAGDLIQHVHVADRDGRVAPGASGRSDYSPIVRTLREIGYDGRISIECAGWDWTEHGRRALDFLRATFA